jgi:predicted ester cyclase
MNNTEARQQMLSIFHTMLDAMNRHDIQACVQCYSVNAELQDPRFPVPARGREVVEEGFRYWFQAFPDVIVTVENIFLDPPQLAVEWRFKATHKGEYMGVSPSGKRVEVLAVAHFRIEGGYVTRDFSVFDATALRQLEALAGGA